MFPPGVPSGAVVIVVVVAAAVAVPTPVTSMTRPKNPSLGAPQSMPRAAPEQVFLHFVQVPVPFFTLQLVKELVIIIVLC